MKPVSDLHILLLAGGVSEERPVSLNSGRAVYAGLLRLNCKVSAIDAGSAKSLLDDDGSFTKEDPPIEDISAESMLSALRARDYSGVDLIFIVLHGGAGEDGRIQKLYEELGLKFTGSNSSASEKSISKPESKRLAMAAGLKSADYLEFNLERQQPEKIAEDIETHFKVKPTFPLIIKPSEGGSTVGLTLVNTAAQILPALDSLATISPLGMAEAYLHGREVTVAVIDGQVWPVVEVKPTAELYDYKSKYTKGGSEYICPAEFPVSVTERLQREAVEIYKALGCSGLARPDFIVDESDETWFLELNNVPGMTELSCAPLAAKTAGISFDKLLEMIIKSALQS